MKQGMLADAAKSVFVLIDVQERLAAAMQPEAIERTVKNAGILLKAAGCLKVPVLMTEQYRKGLGTTVGALAALLPEGAPQFEKSCFSCAGDAGFRDALEASGREQAILAGTEAHVCVLQTALDLRAAGRDVFVVADACCSRSAENHSNAMQRLRQCGVVVTNTESVVFEWLRHAKNEHFKALSALVR